MQSSDRTHCKYLDFNFCQIVSDNKIFLSILSLEIFSDDIVNYLISRTCLARDELGKKL